MSELVIRVDKEQVPPVATISGQINEDSDFSSLKEVESNELIIDFEGVSLINSCGIREWIEFQKNEFNFSKIIYRKCSQVVVEQMNIVKGFIHPAGVIESFYAPYFDEENDLEIKILLTPAEVINSTAPSKFNENKNELEFDDIEQQYFSFLRQK